MLDKELERMIKLTEKEPIRILKIAKYVDEEYDENTKIIRISDALELDSLKDNQCEVVLFNLKTAEKETIIVDFDEDDDISSVRRKIDANLEMIEVKKLPKFLREEKQQ